MYTTIGFGVVTDAETKYHVKVIFFSLIPFVVILLPSVFGLSYSGEEDKIVLLVSLSVSVICLLSYFYYQVYISSLIEYCKKIRRLADLAHDFPFLGILFCRLLIHGFGKEDWSMQKL